MLFLDRQSGVVCPTYRSSERWRNPSDHEKFVFHRVYMQTLISHSSPRPNVLVQKMVLFIVEKVLQIQRKQAKCVSFPVMVDHIMTAHILLDKTTQRFISFLAWQDPCNGAHTFVQLTLLDSHWIRINENRATPLFRSDYLDGCRVVAQPMTMEPMDDLGDFM